MKYIKLNGTDLEVSPICLGTVNYGTDLPKEEAKRQLDQFVDMGGNFIDTAHVYGDWVEGESSRSEKTVGEWFKESGKREKIILSTKGAHPVWGKMDIPRVRPEEIEKDLNESLKYLNTDYIDLYFLHRDDPQIPVSEILDYLDSVQKQGKIRYYGCSNWSLERIKKAEEYARKKNIQGFTVNQLMWSLADINFYNLQDKSFILMDKETYDYHAKTGMNAMAYMSIAKGYFARKHAGEKLPASVTSVYENASNRLIYDETAEIVQSGKYSFIDLSFMYIMAESNFPSVPIASFDDPEQLKTGLSSWDKPIDHELIDKLGRIKKFVYYSQE
jgi:aryl-alcohol dehydrogenase-like predicted oxidoreductase